MPETSLCLDFRPQNRRVLNATLAHLDRVQHGVALRGQLHGRGLTDDAVQAQVEGGRWQWWGRHVVVLHNTALTRRQLMWACVLDAGPGAALASHTALELGGFESFATEAEGIHLVVARGAKVTAVPGVVVHESRRLHPELHLRREGLPCTPLERSAIDAAAWQPWPRFACALLAAVVQQRLTTAAHLELELGRVGRVRHKAHLRAVLGDIAGGAHALSELDLAALCRRHRLQQPVRQRRRRDPDGTWRYLDAEWKLPDGSLLVLEVDGRHHLDVAQWQADLKRERAVVISGRRVLRATSIEVRVEGASIAADLRRAGVPSCQN